MSGDLADRERRSILEDLVGGADLFPLGLEVRGCAGVATLGRCGQCPSAGGAVVGRWRLDAEYRMPVATGKHPVSSCNMPTWLWSPRVSLYAFGLMGERTRLTCRPMRLSWMRAGMSRIRLCSKTIARSISLSSITTSW